MAKRKSKRGNGQGTLFQRNSGGCWLGAYYDHDGKRRTRTAGTTDKAAAQRILNQWVANTALRREGVIDTTAEATALQSRRPISEHLTDFKASQEGKGNSSKRMKDVFTRVQAVVDECEFATLADVNPDALDRFMRSMCDAETAPAAPRTGNGYLQSFGQFIRWAMSSRRLTFNPIAGVSMVKVVGQTINR